MKKNSNRKNNNGSATGLCIGISIGTSLGMLCDSKKNKEVDDDEE